MVVQLNTNKMSFSLLSKFVALFMLCSSSMAQKQVDPADNLIQELRKNMARDRKMLEQYFNSGFLDKVDGFFKDSQLQLNQDPEYQKMLKQFKDSFQGMGSGIRTQWKEIAEGRVYIIHAALKENEKFDLKINKNTVTVSGMLKRDIGRYGKRVMSFKKTFEIPADVDASKVSVRKGEPKSLKKADSEIWIVFPWKNKSRQKNKPILKSPGDRTI